MKPHHSVTVWLAVDDVDEENGGMKIIPGSHLGGLLQHKRQGQTDSIITLELETGTFREADAVPGSQSVTQEQTGRMILR